MTLQEIKDAVDANTPVYWSSESYKVVKDKFNQYFIKHSNGHCIGLTWVDGKTLNGKESEFFTTNKHYENN